MGANPGLAGLQLRPQLVCIEAHDGLMSHAMALERDAFELGQRFDLRP
jgi:hypothetical protein